MNTVLGYGSSSDSENESERKTENGDEQIVAQGASIQDTTSRTKVRQEEATSKSDKAKQDSSILNLNLDLGTDIFGSSESQSTSAKRKIIVPTSSLTDMVHILDHDGHVAKNERKDLHSKPNARREVSIDIPDRKLKRKNEIDESKIIDFDLKDFYDKNHELIEKGDLDFAKHERANKKIKYYNTTGTNQLSDLIKFNAQNTEKLSSIHQIADDKNKKSAQNYNFKKKH